MPRIRFSLLFLMGLFLTLGTILACGSADEPQATTAPAAAAATSVPAPVVAATSAPEVMTAPVGKLTIATRNLRSGAGTPMFCTAGCAETIYLAGKVRK